MLTKKVCLIGDYSVGKTSLFQRFVSHHFSDRYITTVGVKVETRVVEIDSTLSLKLVIWDIAGADRLSTIGKQYLHGAHGYLLVADGTRRGTLDTALSLKTEADSHLNHPPFVGMLNKCDLVDQWEVEDDFLAHHAGWINSSALSGEGVEDAFLTLAKKMAG